MEHPTQHRDPSLFGIKMLLLRCENTSLILEICASPLVQSFDLDGVGSIPAIPRRRLPALLILSIT
jgi:hypothetical protein